MIVFTFTTATKALLFKRTCVSRDIEVRMTPAARKISLSCGIACELLYENDYDNAKAAASSTGIDYKAYRLVGNKATLLI